MLQCQATEDAGALQCALYDGHKDDGHSWASRVTTWEAALERVTVLCDEVATNRHSKYGPDNIKATGEIGLWVRILDKLARISRSMQTGEMDYDDEKFEDAIIDLVNYGRFWLMWRAGQWELPAKCLDEEPNDAPLSFTGEGGKRWAAKSPYDVESGCPSCGVTLPTTQITNGCQDTWHHGA